MHSARPRVEIRPAPRAEALAVLATEHEGRDGKGDFFAHACPDIHVGHGGRERIDAGIVAGVGIGAEHHIHRRVQRQGHVGQAAPAFDLELAVQVAAPQVFLGPGGLQLPRHVHRTVQGQVESLKDRIVRLQPPRRLDRTGGEIPDIDLEHSPLS